MKQKLFSITIKDCRVDTFCSGGKGGQHQNATQSGVRVTHEPSGAVGECREERCQLTNKRRAFVRMAQSKTFRTWVKTVAAEMSSGKSLDTKVDEALAPENLRVEGKNEAGQWTPIK